MRDLWWAHKAKAWIAVVNLFTDYIFVLQTYAADIFFGQSWDDHRLKLPANMTSEYRLLPVEWLGKWLRILIIWIFLDSSVEVKV